MNKIKISIVKNLEQLCNLTGHIWGCWFTIKSAQLDQRWGLNYWMKETHEIQ